MTDTESTELLTLLDTMKADLDALERHVQDKVGALEAENKSLRGWLRWALEALDIRDAAITSAGNEHYFQSKSKVREALK